EWAALLGHCMEHLVLGRGTELRDVLKNEVSRARHDHGLGVVSPQYVALVVDAPCSQGGETLARWPADDEVHLGDILLEEPVLDRPGVHAVAMIECVPGGGAGLHLDGAFGPVAGVAATESLAEATHPREEIQHTDVLGIRLLHGGRSKDSGHGIGS